MNLAALLMLLVVGGVAVSCLLSDWQDFDESADDEDDNPYDGSNGT